MFNKDMGEEWVVVEMKEKQTQICTSIGAHLKCLQTDWANILVKVSESYGNERNIVEPTINTG